MRLSIWIGTVIAAIGLAACEDTNSYPLSGQECVQSDPVVAMEAHNCLPVLPGL